MDKLSAYLNVHRRMVKQAWNPRPFVQSAHKALAPYAGPLGTIGLVGFLGSMALPLAGTFKDIYENETRIAARGKQWRAEAAKLGIPYDKYKSMMKAKNSVSTTQNQYTNFNS